MHKPGLYYGVVSVHRGSRINNYYGYGIVDGPGALLQLLREQHGVAADDPGLSNEVAYRVDNETIRRAAASQV